MLNRRGFLQGMVSAFAVPAIGAMPALEPSMAVLTLEGFDPVTGDALIRMTRIRELLLPGLWEISGRYSSIEGQWDKIFHEPG